MHSRHSQAKARQTESAGGANQRNAARGDEADLEGVKDHCSVARRALSLKSTPLSKPNTSAPKTAVPKTAPRLRDSETMAAAAPSRWRPASVWMVTCAVGITVPNPIPQTNPQAAMVHGGEPAHRAAAACRLTASSRYVGIGVGRLVLATMDPSSSTRSPCRASTAAAAGPNGLRRRRHRVADRSAGRKPSRRSSWQTAPPSPPSTQCLDRASARSAETAIRRVSRCVRAAPIAKRPQRPAGHFAKRTTGTGVRRR